MSLGLPGSSVFWCGLSERGLRSFKLSSLLDRGFFFPKQGLRSAWHSLLGKGANLRYRGYGWRAKGGLSLPSKDSSLSRLSRLTQGRYSLTVSSGLSQGVAGGFLASRTAVLQQRVMGSLNPGVFASFKRGEVSKARGLSFLWKARLKAVSVAKQYPTDRNASLSLRWKRGQGVGFLRFLRRGCFLKKVYLQRYVPSYRRGTFSKGGKGPVNLLSGYRGGLRSSVISCDQHRQRLKRKSIWKGKSLFFFAPDRGGSPVFRTKLQKTLHFFFLRNASRQVLLTRAGKGGGCSPLPIKVGSRTSQRTTPRS